MDGGAGPAKPGAGVDPIFQRAEPPAPRAQKRTLLLWQFFFFPVLIVIAALGVFMAFRLLAGGEASPATLIDQVLNGGANQQKHASQQLALEITDARMAADVARAEGRTVEPPFYAAADFKEKLLRAYDLALDEESEERQQWLAKALGRAEVHEALPRLLDTIYPATGAEHPQAVRRAAATGILSLESRRGEAALVRMTREKGDAQIRVIGYSGLAMLGTERLGGPAGDGPEVVPALRRGLDDAMAGVRFNAAYGLAIRGDASAAPVLKQSLDRATLEKHGVTPVNHALKNGILAAVRLGDPALRPLVERLTDDAHEPEDDVRAFAREALERWDATSETPEAPHGG